MEHRISLNQSDIETIVANHLAEKYSGADVDFTLKADVPQHPTPQDPGSVYGTAVLRNYEPSSSDPQSRPKIFGPGEQD